MAGVDREETECLICFSLLLRMPAVAAVTPFGNPPPDIAEGAEVSHYTILGLRGHF